MVMKKVPRGIRNNNPFNIKKTAIVWLGEFDGKDKVFETFQTLEFGVRAGIKLLMNYISNGYDTPRKIINRFAPYSENDTQNYLDFVCQHSHVSPDVSLKVLTLPFIYFCFSIIRYETGLSCGQLSDLHLSISDIQSVIYRYFD